MLEREEQLMLITIAVSQSSTYKSTAVSQNTTYKSTAVSQNTTYKSTAVSQNTTHKSTAVSQSTTHKSTYRPWTPLCGSAWWPLSGRWCSHTCGPPALSNSGARCHQCPQATCCPGADESHAPLWTLQAGKSPTQMIRHKINTQGS